MQLVNGELASSNIFEQRVISNKHYLALPVIAMDLMFLSPIAMALATRTSDKSPHLLLPILNSQGSQKQGHRGGIATFTAIIGSLFYLAATTRPDMSCAASALSRHMGNPTTELLQHVYHVCRYLAGTS
jgi:hypothetical protein